jgi:hypothetical protein
MAGGGANCTAASGCCAGDPTDFSYMSLGFGAGQRRWTVFSGGVSIDGGGAARGPDRCRGC